MELSYTATVQSTTTWYSKGYGAVFVKEEKDIPKVYELLVEQDDYWAGYDDNSSDLIRLLPENPDPRKLTSSYIGKRDIYDLPELYKKLEELGIDVFITWRMSEEYDY